MKTTKIKLDIDGSLNLHRIEQIHSLFTRMFNNLKAISAKVSKSPSGKGWHVEIEYNRNFTPMEIVCIQSLMGSDHMREAFNFSKARNHMAYEKKGIEWNIMFSKKHELLPDRKTLKLIGIKKYDRKKTEELLAMLHQSVVVTEE